MAAFSICVRLSLIFKKRGGGGLQIQKKTGRVKRETRRGWCNEVIILLLSTVGKLSLALIDVSGRVIWHFHAVAGTQLEMSDCGLPPPLPSLSTFGALSLMWPRVHVRVHIRFFLCPVSKVTADYSGTHHHTKPNIPCVPKSLLVFFFLVSWQPVLCLICLLFVF